MSSLKTFVFLFVAIIAVGCGAKPIDLESRFDDDVENAWSTKWKWVDAVQFFEKGGMYVDSGDPEDPALDRPHVLPLLKRLQQEFGLEWQAVLDNTNQTTALAVVARLPNDSTIRQRIEASLQREQASFPGDILQQWGHKWLTLDFLNEAQAKFMEEEDTKKTK